MKKITLYWLASLVAIMMIMLPIQSHWQLSLASTMTEVQWEHHNSNGQIIHIGTPQLVVGENLLWTNPAITNEQWKIQTNQASRQDHLVALLRFSASDIAHW